MSVIQAVRVVLYFQIPLLPCYTPTVYWKASTQLRNITLAIQINKLIFSENLLYLQFGKVCWHLVFLYSNFTKNIRQLFKYHKNTDFELLSIIILIIYYYIFTDFKNSCGWLGRGTGDGVKEHFLYYSYCPCIAHASMLICQNSNSYCHSVGIRYFKLRALHLLSHPAYTSTSPSPLPPSPGLLSHCWTDPYLTSTLSVLWRTGLQLLRWASTETTSSTQALPPCSWWLRWPQSEFACLL